MSIASRWAYQRSHSLSWSGQRRRRIGAVDSRPRRPTRSTGAPQLGQVLGKWKRVSVAVARVGLDPDDLGDDLAGLLDHDRVADPDVLALELVGVVQAGALDGRAGQQHRLELGDRRQLARLADLDV